MTPAEAVARVRIEVDEATAGKWSDTEIYRALDAGQNSVIQFALAKEQMDENKQYRSPVLVPLITLDSTNTTTTGSGYQEYSLPSDFIGHYLALYSYTNAGTQYPCALTTFAEAVKRSVNVYANNFKSPLAYIRAEKLGFFPQPIGAGANNFAHYYYKQPSEVVASGSPPFTLREETHEAIIEFALYYLFNKDNDQRAFTHLNNFIQKIQGLC